MRVAFTLIGGKNWTGGYNYLLNLVRVLTEHQSDRVTPVLFFGTDTDEAEAAPFAAIGGVEVVRSPVMNQTHKTVLLSRGLLLGLDGSARDLFHHHRIDLVFESAMFFGWRLDIPTIAWIPDFQHRALPHLFTRVGYWKRELGIRAQVACGRAIMLSSEDSRRACEKFYPSTVGRTHAVRFAVPPGALLDTDKARALADSYGLPEQFFFLPNQFWQHKNHLLVIEALAMLRDRGHSVVIAVSGKQADPRNPGHFPRVQQRLAQLELENAFRLLGMIPYPHLAALMGASVALLNPSSFEGWSTTVEEARSLGVPMVLSNLPVHREQAGADATYFDTSSPESLADALHAFQPLARTEREQRAAAAREDATMRVRRFSNDFLSLVERSIGPTET